MSERLLNHLIDADLLNGIEKDRATIYGLQIAMISIWVGVWAIAGGV